MATERLLKAPDLMAVDDLAESLPPAQNVRVKADLLTDGQWRPVADTFNRSGGHGRMADRN
jgi:hypothetical protein